MRKLTPPPSKPTREQLRAVMAGFNLTTADVAAAVGVDKQTATYWLAESPAKRQSQMPAGLFELLTNKCAVQLKAKS